MNKNNNPQMGCFFIALKQKLKEEKKLKIENLLTIDEINNLFQKATSCGTKYVVICRYDKFLQIIPITNSLNDISLEGITKIFAIDNTTAEFEDMPKAKEIKDIIIKHFETEDNIVFILKDDSVYRYSKSDIGDLTGIKANHNTIIFQTNRFFYVKYIKRICSHTNIL